MALNPSVSPVFIIIFQEMGRPNGAKLMGINY